MSRFDFDQAMRLFWRGPLWGPLTFALRRLGRPWLPVLRVGSPDPPPGPLLLDAWRPEVRSGLVAGAAVVDITPARLQGVCLAGFGAKRLCTGLRDPIRARALALHDGQTPLVIVCLDLIGLSLPRVRRIRSQLTELHPGSLLLVCTHNHQAPDTLGLWGDSLFGVLPVRSGLDLGYQRELEIKVIDVVGQAIEAARPARLHLAAGEFDSAGRLVHNEREALLDRGLRVMHLTDRHGQAIATLAQHACHPETLWKQNTQMSADFCAVCCRQLESSLGGIGLYANGALGAMVSAAIPHETGDSVRAEFVERLGAGLGRAAARLARRSLAAPVPEPIIRALRSEVRLSAGDNRLYELMHALGVVEQRELVDGLVTEVSLARVGPASLVGLPGEPAPALGLEILRRVPGGPRFLFGLADDELGYLLPPEYFHDPRYAYEQTMTPGPQAAVRLALAVERLVRDSRR